MMSLSNLPRFLVALTAVFIYLVLTFSSAGAWVLCYEPDGRVTMEQSIEGVCGDVWEIQQKRLVTSQAGEDKLKTACQYCKDVPISLKNVQPADVRPLVCPVGDTVAVTGALHPQVVNPLQRLPLVVFPNPPPKKSPIHQHLDSIVLII